MVHGISIDMANLISRTLTGVSDKCIEIDHEIASRSISVESGTTELIIGFRWTTGLTALPPNGAQFMVGFSTGGVLPYETPTTGQAWLMMRNNPNTAWTLGANNNYNNNLYYDFNVEGTSNTSQFDTVSWPVFPASSLNSACYTFFSLKVNGSNWQWRSLITPAGADGDINPASYDLSQAGFEAALEAQTPALAGAAIQADTGSSAGVDTSVTFTLWPTSINASGGLPDTVFFRSYLSSFPLQLASVGAYRWA